MKSFYRRLIASSKPGLAVLAGVLLSVAAVTQVWAWGPERPAFTIEKPATYVTFNSITNNPSHGDERNFMQVREQTASNETYSDTISLSPGKEYVVYVYYHNNAADNYNAGGTGIAHGAYARAEIPAIVKNGGDTKAVAHVGAANAQPNDVYDDIVLKNTTGGDIALRYVPGSTTIHSFGKVNGVIMPDTIISSGVSLGYDALDGNLPGCHKYAGYITFRVKADQPSFTFSKDVRKAGASGWTDSLTANVGDKIEYRLSYKNAGTTTQNDVVLKDVLPAGVEYQKGSSKLYNANNSNGVGVSDAIAGGGANIGNYNAGSNAFYTFTAKITDAALTRCGENTLTNTASVETNNGNMQDTARVVVTKLCGPNECLPGVPVGDSRCMPGTTVTQLPSTGPRETLLALAVITMVVLTAMYWYTNRHPQGLKQQRIYAARQPRRFGPKHLIAKGRQKIAKHRASRHR